jgi:Ca2+/Na+ antiporter
VVGSNIFNTLRVPGLTATVAPEVLPALVASSVLNAACFLPILHRA